VLECHPDEVVWDRGGKQPSGGFPERVDIRRPVEAEQRPLDYGIDDWFALHIQPSGPNAPISGAIAILFIRLEAARSPPGPGKVGDQKSNLSYLAIGNQALRLNFKRKEK